MVLIMYITCDATQINKHKPEIMAPHVKEAQLYNKKYGLGLKRNSTVKVVIIDEGVVVVIVVVASQNAHRKKTVAVAARIE